jgi:hypothetical protein
MKKILLKSLISFGAISIVSSITPIVLTTCSKTENETEYLINLYKNRIGKFKDGRPVTADEYFLL